MLPAHYRKEDKPGYFCRFTFGQFFTLLVLEIFTLFFIFYLGARFGRTLLGIERPAPVAERNGLPEVKTADPNVVATTQDPEIQEMAKDILEQAPTPDLKQRVAEMLRESKIQNSKSEMVRQTHHPEQSRRTNKSKIGNKTTKPRDPDAHKVLTEPVIQMAPKSPFAIQVGSYPNPDEAHHWVSHWKQKGYQAFLVSADIPGKGRWYRVRLGRFDSKEEAQSYLKDFQSREGIEAFIAPNR